ncbi:MAG: hypothetical protein WCH39_20845, partial [Schlesneria sp.]
YNKHKKTITSICFRLLFLNIWNVFSSDFRSLFGGRVVILSPRFSVMITSDFRDSDFSMKNAAFRKMTYLKEMRTMFLSRWKNFLFDWGPRLSLAFKIGRN